MRGKKPRFAPPNPKAERKYLKDFYENEYIVNESDEEGLGPSGIQNLSKLIVVLKRLRSAR